MNVEMTTMVMIQDPQTKRVLVQNRIKRWKGLSFPGGHVEPGESAHDCAVREIREETGLDIRNLTFCGMIHWCHQPSDRRYMVFLYRTATFSGDVIPEMEEGQHFWMDYDALKESVRSQANHGNTFHLYFPLFDGQANEGFSLWSDQETREMTYLS
ncbi:MAG: 8-oxo-dGTP diphosphatase [Oscillospiraceae bacterium]|jgi:8-oxo-dGTP diphosphatase|nr:8-oxo-dGTP diphosphatase [Oscillospiraceae bacterium]